MMDADLACITVTEWMEFVEKVDGLLNASMDRPGYLFRGQAREEWTLQPSLVRALPPGVVSATALEWERRAKAYFRAHAALHMPHASLAEPEDDLAWWTTMQHYGAPTRLLDWTASPLVALYFAVEQHFDASGAVWLVHPHSVQSKYPGSVTDHPSPLDAAGPPAVYFVVRSSFLTDRMAAQQTHFSVSNDAQADHFPPLFLATGPDAQRLRKIIIPGSAKRKMLSRLRAMNVHAHALFPGVDGLGRSVRELLSVAALFPGATDSTAKPNSGTSSA